MFAFSFGFGFGVFRFGLGFAVLEAAILRKKVHQNFNINKGRLIVKRSGCLPKPRAQSSDILIYSHQSDALVFGCHPYYYICDTRILVPGLYSNGGIPSLLALCLQTNSAKGLQAWTLS